MEDREIQKKWYSIRHKFLKTLGKKPDLNAFLFIIGAQESGIVKDSFSKEEKQDLMHIAISTFLERDGYCKFEGRDDQGWPHWKFIKSLPKRDKKEQERWLMYQVVLYFEDV